MSIEIRIIPQQIAEIFINRSEEIDPAISKIDECLSILFDEVIGIGVGIFYLDVTSDEVVVGPVTGGVVWDFLVEGDTGYSVCGEGRAACVVCLGGIRAIYFIPGPDIFRSCRHTTALVGV